MQQHVIDALRDHVGAFTTTDLACGARSPTVAPALPPPSAADAQRLTPHPTPSYIFTSNPTPSPTHKHTVGHQYYKQVPKLKSCELYMLSNSKGLTFDDGTVLQAHLHE